MTTQKDKTAADFCDYICYPKQLLMPMGKGNRDHNIALFEQAMSEAAAREREEILGMVERAHDLARHGPSEQLLETLVEVIRARGESK